MIPEGPGMFEVRFRRGGASIALPVWTWRPDRPRCALVVLHGTARNAGAYRDDWIAHARGLGALLLAPEFTRSAFPTAREYEVGNMRSPERVPLPCELWTFQAVEQVFEAARAAAGADWRDYLLYGHSAGGQLVHRMVTYLPEARVAAAVAANAGCYTVPHAGEPFPYGLDGMPLAPAALTAAFARPLTVLLGEADDDPQHPQLLRSAAAMRQGPHRLARGRHYFAAAQEAARALGVEFGWRLRIVPGAGHSNRAMAPAAAAALRERPGRAAEPRPAGLV